MPPKREHVMISGDFEIVSDRVLSVNGIAVVIPERGYAHIGIELRVHNDSLTPYVRELGGDGGGRFGFLHLGNQELGIIKGMATQKGQLEIPFMFTIPHERPKMTLN